MDNLFFDPKLLGYLGKEAIIGKAVRIRKPQETFIGDYTIIDDFTYISCPLRTGLYCHVGSSVTISGGSGALTIGDFVGIASGTAVYAASSDYMNTSFELPSIPKDFQLGGTVEPVFMADHVLLGSHSVVLPGVRLPEGFACAAQTTVRKARYDAWTLYGGATCRKLVRREHLEVLERARELKARNL